MAGKSKRQKELEQKEFESEIERELRLQELELEHQEKADSDYHPAGLFAIRFFGNLMIGFIINYMFNWLGGRYISMISPEIASGIRTIMLVLIVGFALIGAVTKISPWERLIR